MISIVFTGFVVGLLVGLTGMGGGLLMTPLLILFYGFSPTMAVGTDLIYAAVTKAVGSWQHIQQKTLDWQIVRKLAIGSIPGGIIGVWLIQLLKRLTPFPVEDVLGRVIGFTFVFVAILMFAQLLLNRKNGPKIRFNAPLTLVGLAGGLLVGLTSVGSGSMFMVVLLSSTGLTASKLVGTDVVHAFFLTLSAGLVHASFGHVDVSFVLWLLLGSIPGILIGGRLTLKVPDLWLRFLIILVLFITGIKMI
ncbi:MULTISPECIES: sulfite exporter TauE/SafE family protein [Thermoactinomyces]|jgi:uncharacterized protein|uniref:Probable membrane transporter protein n=1 Tax=Thermoactinomyces daqus TaxID=1329516 RepID=A0A7W1XBL1_9BACL|nr:MULTISPECIES: sulfite exporter TauE/SafE family protein [Thermoactinomyces]MBA4543635.1 sulfite exporter TauE/SafE family protein [Thermoactinomyces daqus]MBH8597086.1 sulfite exporter TauE/SafE family protein [Thermoactinomyces sp. CICC 10523]MBH8602646.1 sulfite exporter TauE/SafE family protein [Thermoactinomyces sp. CICC 10522]MBH8606243.1 sulfite exporter TauE/SafE family protein [Thermoactinomyces sp. CICC 10521]